MHYQREIFRVMNILYFCKLLNPFTKGAKSKKVVT